MNNLLHNFQNQCTTIIFLLKILKMQSQNKSYTQQEDNSLRTLRKGRNIKKWSQTPKNSQQNFSFRDKNGKLCTQRNNDHLSPDLKKQDWSREEQNLLINLHNLKGNKWAEIAKVLGRSDNAVKNHYHSKLRKGLRRINCRISNFFRYQHKLFKNNILSKIVQTAEETYNSENKDKKGIGRACYEMKNKILEQAEDFENLASEQKDDLKKLVIEMNVFNRTFKKNNRRTEKSGIYLPKIRSFLKNGNSNYSVQNQELDSSNQKNVEEQLDQKQKQEQDIAAISQKNLQVFGKQNKTKQTWWCQQAKINYQLRNIKVRQTIKIQFEQEKMNVNLQKEIEKLSQEKANCKTPNQFQEANLSINPPSQNLMNIGFLPHTPFYFQYFNYPICQPIMNSFNFFGNNQNSEFFIQNTTQPMNLLMIPTNNFAIGIDYCSEPQNQKDSTSQTYNKLSFQQSFIPFKKDVQNQNQV